MRKFLVLAIVALLSLNTFFKVDVVGLTTSLYQTQVAPRLPAVMQNDLARNIAIGVAALVLLSYGIGTTKAGVKETVDGGKTIASWIATPVVLAWNILRGTYNVVAYVSRATVNTAKRFDSRPRDLADTMKRLTIARQNHNRAKRGLQQAQNDMVGISNEVSMAEAQLAAAAQAVKQARGQAHNKMLEIASCELTLKETSGEVTRLEGYRDRFAASTKPVTV